MIVLTLSLSGMFAILTFRSIRSDARCNFWLTTYYSHHPRRLSPPTMSLCARPVVVLYCPQRPIFALHSGGQKAANKLRPCLVTDIVGNKMRLAPFLSARTNSKVRGLSLNICTSYTHIFHRCDACLGASLTMAHMALQAPPVRVAVQ